MAWHESEAKDEAQKADIWVTYVLNDSDPRAAKRKVAFSNQNREMWFVMLPLQKKYFKTKPRTTGTAAGEETTHDSTYTKVEARPLPCLPRLDLAKKEAVVGGEVKDIPTGPGCKAAKTGHPLFWQELKSVDFLVSVLNDFGIGYVFDLSPGSGAMAIACVRNGVAYDGVCANEEHQQWLNGLLDMATLAVEGEAGENTKEGEQSLAAKIKQRFGTAVAEAKRMLQDAGDKGGESDESSSETLA